MTAAEQYTFERLTAAIKGKEHQFDSVEISNDCHWDEENGSFRYTKTVRFANDPIARTLFIHSFKGTVTHIVFSSNGVDIIIDGEQFAWGPPSEYEIRKWVADWIAELMR
jgi:hypothetical protein